jgi:hypothetical protein
MSAPFSNINVAPDANNVVAHGRTPGVIVSVAHLDDEERALVLGVLLEELLS